MARLGRRTGYRPKGKVAPVLDVNGAFNAVARVAATHGLKLKQEDIEQPYTDPSTKTVHVPFVNAYWGKTALLGWLGAVYHECGHWAPEVQDIIKHIVDNGIDMASLFGSILNIVEDWRNEFNGYGDWPGRDEALSYVQGFFANKGMDNIKKLLSSPDPVSEDMELLINVLAWVYSQRAPLQPDLALISHEYNELDIVDPARYLHLNEELHSLKTAEDVVNLTKKILESSGKDPEEEEQKAQGSSSGDEGEEGEKAQESEGKAGGKAGKSEDSDETESYSKSTISYKDLIGHEFDPTKEEQSEQNSELRINYDHEPIYDYTPYDRMLVQKARDLRKSKKSSYLADDEDMREMYHAGSKLASQARRLFQSRSQSLITHNNKAGRLDRRDLYRIPAGHQDVFTKKVNRVCTKNTAIFLLTDASGSMNWHGKFSIAGASAALLNDALKPIGIPLEIAAFTDTYKNGCEHYVVKTFTEQRSGEAIIDDYVKIRPHAYQNTDGESIMWAYRELMKRPESRKILIVISDGSPHSDHGQDCYTYTKNVVQFVEQQVECYGIGLLDQTVKAFYREHTVLKDAGDLEECLLNVIERKIFE